jgi:hypothetical protein
MSSRSTPGRRLKRLIDAALAPVAVGPSRSRSRSTRRSRRRTGPPRCSSLLDVEMAKRAPSSRRATELAGEIRMLDATVVRLVTGLVPRPRGGAEISGPCSRSSIPMGPPKPSAGVGLVARRDRPIDNGAALREYLLEQVIDFRDLA